MNPLDSFWNGVLSLLTPIVTPDWGQLVTVIPWLLLLLVLGFLALIGRAWVRLLRSQPARGPKVRRRPLRPLVLGHVAVVATGIVTVILAFAAGARTDWTGATSPAGLFVNVPLLFLGLGLIIGTTGNAARLWERSGRDDFEPDLIDHIAAAVRRHPARAQRVVVFIAGVLIAATGLLLGTVPGWAHAAAQGGWPTDVPPEPLPVAAIPVLLLGLVLAVGSVGSGIAALWRNDRNVADAQDDEGGSSLVVAKH